MEHALPREIVAASAAHADGAGADGERRAACVGIVGAGVPDALVIACGARPIFLTPSEAPTPRADAFVPGEAKRLKALAELALDGRLAHLDLLVVTRSHEWLYYTLKEAVRVGEAVLPPLHLCDVVFTDSEAARRHNLRQLGRLIEALTRVTGLAPDDAALATAMAQENSRAERLRLLQQRRDEGRVAGSDALAVVAAARAMPAAAFVEALDPWLARIADVEPWPGPRLLLLPSEASDVAALHTAVEAAGAIVVAEDSERGSRSATPPIGDGDPLAALVAATMAAASGPEVQPRAARVGWAEDQLRRADLDGVIFALPADDRRSGWDYPALRDAAAAAGRPALLLRDDPALNPDEVGAALSAFVGSIGKGKAA